MEQGAEFLRREGCTVIAAAESVESAALLIEKEKPQLLLVDWMLNGNGTGLDLCRRNERIWQLPILMVTARGDEFAFLFNIGPSRGALLSAPTEPLRSADV